VRFCLGSRPESKALRAWTLKAGDGRPQQGVQTKAGVRRRNLWSTMPDPVFQPVTAGALGPIASPQPGQNGAGSAIRQSAEAPLSAPARLGSPTFQVDLVHNPQAAASLGASAEQAGSSPPTWKGEGAFSAGAKSSRAARRPVVHRACRTTISVVEKGLWLSGSAASNTRKWAIVPQFSSAPH